jgi:4-diphosphocytidyl-2-C-methyl-D-erythritol kinase
MTAITRIAFPNAKINLGLQVRKRREDGFHAIESLFLPIGWCDTLEIETLSKGAACGLHSHGLPIPGEGHDNLILRAHRLLSENFDLPPVQFHLVKSIPMGAGLGGGSADGAFALNLLNTHFNLGLSNTERETLAAKLGSDCPFFIQNTPAHVSGRGEHIRPIALQLSGWWLVVLHPGVHISTPQAFGWVMPNDDRPGLQTWENSAPDDWTDKLHNDFTAPIASKVPDVAEALRMLGRWGATYADMSGSGSAVFGCFREEPAPQWTQSLPEGWTGWSGPLGLR